MKKYIPATEENRRSLKQRLRASLAMLLVAVILMVITTYAWLVLSIAPEVAGISTTIGANGSLEIALLTKETFSDPNLVPTLTSASLSSNLLEANMSWGNMVDLNDQSYGLQEIVLYPSRLNITGTPGNYKVDRNGSMLLVPTYGSDGRIIQLTDKTYTGTYGDKGFYSYADAQFGVRAIGTASSVSVQGSALDQAKRNIPTYMSSAISSAKSSLDGVQDLLLKFAAGGDSFTTADIDVLKRMIERLQASEEYIEDALRQGLVAIAASAIADEFAFETTRTMILSESSISDLLDDFNLSIPSVFMNWVTAQKRMENNLNAAMAQCNILDPESATKQDVKVILDYLMNLDQVLVGNTPFSSLTREDLLGMAAGGLELILKPGSGVYADIADFTGNYSASVGSMASLKTASIQNPSYLNLLLSVVNTLTPAGGGNVGTDVKLEDTFGYVLDLGFRCNAFASDLLLQTAGVQRVYSDSSSDATMGGGSYMEFATVSDMNFDRLTALMNAVRVAFVDDFGNVLGIAKLNVSNRVLNEENGNIMAPLYLYDYSIGTGVLDNGKLIMGERRKTDNVLTSLVRNQAKAVSTLVWLDGDIVDNTMVSAESNISGILNLQFSSSANLLPANNNALIGYVADKDGLNQLITDVYDNYISLGRSNYTTVSWNNLLDAYKRAEVVNNNEIASENLIYNTTLNLNAAVQALQTMDGDFLQLAIDEIRAIMGQTSENARLLYRRDENGAPVLLTTYTQEQLDNSIVWIKSVDNEKNLRDEGNGLYTPIYTVESWNNLANALYYAEALQHCAPSPELKDNAAVRLQAALENLDFAVFFTPYVLEDCVYYKAFSKDADTYGTWYYSDMKRVLGEGTILELDAYAVKAEYAYVSGVPDWIDDGDRVLTPYLHFNYELQNQEVAGIYWDMPSGWAYQYTAEQQETFSSLYWRADWIDATIPSAASSVSYNNGNFRSNVSMEQAEAAIEALRAAIQHKSDADKELDAASLSVSVRIMLTQAVRNAQLIIDNNDKPTMAMNSKLKALSNAMRSAETLLADSKTKNNQGRTALKELNTAIAQFDSKLQVSSADAYPMTSTQRFLLNEAVLRAQSVAGYDDETVQNDKMIALRAAVASIDRLLLDSAASNVDAEAALLMFNQVVTHYGKNLAVSEYNSIRYSLPEDLSDFDLEYHALAMENPALIGSVVNGATYDFGATVITTAGVVYRTAVDSGMGYVQAYGVELPELESNLPTDGGYNWSSWNGKMAVNTTVTIPEMRLLNNSNETITSVTYSTSDVDVLEWVEGTTFTSKDVCASATIQVTVETLQGNIYSAAYPVSVEVYKKAAGIIMPQLTDNLPAGGSLVDGCWDGKMSNGATVTLPSFQFVNRVEKVMVEDENGQLVETEEIIEHTETVDRVVYSTSGGLYVEEEPDENGKVNKKYVYFLTRQSDTTFTANDTYDGVAKVLVTVYTDQGNKYEAEYPVSIVVE